MRLDVVATVAGRCVIGAIVLGCVATYLGRRGAAMAWRTRGLLMLAGVVLGIHWICFFESARRSTVAIGMVAAFTFPVFSALIEPLVFRERFRPRTLATAGVVLLGVSCLLLADPATGSVAAGVGFGLTASILFVIRNLLTRHAVAIVGGVRAMAWQVGTAAVMLGWALVVYVDAAPDTGTIVGLLYLGIVPTALTHTLFIRSFRHFSVATASVITSLQLLWGPLYAWAALGEQPDLPVIAGGGIVLAAVVYESIAAGREGSRLATVEDVDVS